MINYKYISLLSQIGGKPKRIKVPREIPETHSWLYCPLLLYQFHDVQFDLSLEMIAAINKQDAIAGTNVSTILSTIREFYIANDINLTNRSNLDGFNLPSVEGRVRFDGKQREFYFHLSAGSQERLATEIEIYAFVGIIADVLLKQFRGQSIGSVNLPGEVFAEATAGTWPRMIAPPAGVADPTWKCNICNLNNSTALLNCSRCKYPRGAVRGAADAGDSSEDSWACSTCTFSNGMDAMACNACTMPKNPHRGAAASWACSTCTFSNGMDAKACSACTMPKNPHRGAADANYSCTTCTSDIVCEVCGFNAMVSLVENPHSRVWICPRCTHPNERKCNVCNTPF